MKKIISFMLLFFCMGTYTYSQKAILQQPSCGSESFKKALIKEHPEIQERINEVNSSIKEARRKGTANRVAPGKLTIPVVVYIIHDGTAAVNISDVQVQSQIAALNSNFSDYGLEFCLATKTEGSPTIAMPTGAVQTVPGIIHVNSPTQTNHLINDQSQLVLSNNTAGNYGVTQDKFLRIWVVKSIADGATEGIVGYSLFPGMSPFFDGIVMRYDVFGDVTNCAGCNLLASNNLGRTLVHEVGHYLNLLHTFQGGCSGDDAATCEDAGDLVCDTPQVNSQNFGCPFGTNSCGTDLPDDISNYMDYTNDGCRNEFTPGQKERMFTTLNLYRNKLFAVDNLINAGVCGSSTLLSATFTPSSYQVCRSTTNAVTFTPLVVNAPNTSYLWNFGDPTSTSNTSNVTGIASHIYSSSTGSPFTVKLTLTRNGQVTEYSTQIYVTTCLASLSQYNWCLSSGNALKFSSGVPVVDTTYPVANLISRGCAIQNSTAIGGSPYFYTNGIKVWKGDHSLLNTTAGTYTPLMGNRAAPNGVVIVPNPANTSSYYIFTKGAMMSTIDDNFLDGFRSTVITMSGSVPSMPVATVNQPVTALTGMTGFLAGNNGALYGGTSIAAFKHCDGYYIFTTLKKSTAYYLTVFSLTATGLVYKSSIVLPNNDYADKIQISPNGNKVAYTSWNSKAYLLFDFDKYSGVLSNQKTLFEANSNTSLEGLEFSPDSKLIYASNLFKAFYQINITTVNPLLSREIITTEFIPRTLKIGPDGKIYYINSPYVDNYRIGVIHKPNVLVSATNPNACELSPNGPLMPNPLISSFNDLALPSTVPVATSNSISAYASSCNSYKFFPNVSSSQCYSSFKWDFGDVNSGTTNNVSTLTEPIHTFSAPGTYTVKVYSSTDVLIAQTTITIESIAPLEIFGDSSACITGNHITYNSVNIPAGHTVLWTITGGSGTIVGANDQSEVSVNWSSLPGIITVKLTNSTGCTATSTKNIGASCTEENIGAGANDTVYTTNIQSDGKIIFGGDFTTYNNTPVNRFGRLNTTMGLDATFTVGTGANGTVRSSVILSTGKIYIGGSFTNYNGTAKYGMARINTTGVLDTSFALPAGMVASVTAMAVQTNNYIVAVGSFQQGSSIKEVMRFTDTGAIDPSFVLDGSITNFLPNAVAIQSDGKIIIGGAAGVRRVTTTGAIDATFNQNSVIYNTNVIKIQPDGKILVGGNLFEYVPSEDWINQYLTRLNSNGTADTTFQALLMEPLIAWGQVQALILQSDNRIIVGSSGTTSVNGNPVGRFFRLLPNGSYDATFPTGAGIGPEGTRTSPSGAVYTLSLQTDGKVVIGGHFSTYNGYMAKNITRVSNVSPVISRPAEPTNEIIIAKNGGIAIYPNPVMTSFTISTSGIQTDTVEIYNSLGQLVKKQRLSSDTSEVHIEDIASGIYYMKIFNKDVLLKTDKIVKK